MFAKRDTNISIGRLGDTIEKIHDHINSGRFALAASDIEVDEEGHPPPLPEGAEPGGA